MKDTYNLLADGIVKLLRALAAVANTTLPEWAEAQRYERYLGSSIKGEAAIDWSDRKARAALLAELVVDADRLLELARQALERLPPGWGRTSEHSGWGGVVGTVAAPGHRAQKRRCRWRC